MVLPQGFGLAVVYIALYRIEITGLNLGKFTVSNPSGRETAGIRNLKTHPTETYTAMCHDRIQGFVWESRV